MKLMGSLRPSCVTAAALAALMLGNTGAGLVLTPGQSTNQNPQPQRVAPTPTRTAPTPTPPHRTDRESPDAPTTIERETPARRTVERGTVTPMERGTLTRGGSVPLHGTPDTPKVTHNPHVRAAVVTRVEHVKQRLADDRRFAHERAYHAWHRYWDYAVWLEQNTGRGRIVGVVRDGSGLAVFDAKVWLRDSAGHALRVRADQHVTLSNEGGTFSMRHVHRGVYSVWAKLGADMARSQFSVIVHPGHVSFAMVRMGA